MAEFLPLCDVLFNVISLAGYFCDVVFDLVMSYALLERGYKASFTAAISIVITSLVITQVLSLRWYLSAWSASERKARAPYLVMALHCLQLGVLWRYARLLAPLELRRGHVKHQVRDLCMLRLVHAFCEAAPMLLLQLHILFKVPPEPGGEVAIEEPTANKAFEELNVISASLSLFSVCWALASFSKNVRRQNVHRLQLTWLGVIFQFLWRLGTISARICALTAYALVYKYWVFLVIGLHWVSMFLWLLSPKTVFDGERLGRGKKAVLSALIAGVYVLAYINLQELRPRPTMVTFYGVMFVENALLLCAWWSGAGGGAGAGALPAAAGAYCLGLGFMLLYYRYFHVRRLGYMLGENQQGTNSTNASSQNKNGKQSNAADNAAIPGVFNCRFTNPVNNSATGRKKKKPTSFVPPPPAPATAFWRRPLPHNHHGGSSENEGSSVGSRVNIQQKLQEKKQKQLAELRVIEEEIKQGKLAKTTPVAAEEIYSSLQRQPIPRAKTHAEPLAWPSIDVSHPYQNYPVPHTCNYPTYTEIKNYTNFQNNNTENELKIHRRYEEPRTFYENPANLHNETVLRSPNYLENRSYESNCGSPRNVLNNSLTNYIDNYEAPSDKRLPNVYEDNDFSYSEQYGKELHVLATVPSLEVRGYECGAGRCARRALRGRCRTPEVLLAPHYLEACSRPVCCHWGAHTNRKKEEGAASSGEESAPDGAARDTPRPPSDIDSQISLPRSYTLPREFRYWRRRPRLRDAHLPSNNSSDGDVDSGDNDSDRRSNCSAASQLQTYSELRHAPTHASHGAHGPHAHGAHGAHAHGPHAPLALDDYERRRRRKPAPKPETKL